MRMGASTKEHAVIVAASLAIVVVFLLSLPKLGLKPISDPPSKPAYVALELDAPGADVGIDDLNDYAPMFIPTRWNCTGIRRFSNPAPWRFFEPDLARVYEKDVKIDPGVKALEFSDRERMLMFMRGSFASFPMQAQPIEPLARNSSITVRDVKTGEVVRALKIAPISGDPNLGIAEFSMCIISGIPQLPMLVKSSGSDAVDSRISEMLQGKIPLPDGEFKIIVSP